MSLSAQQISPVPGYEQVFGSKKHGVYEFTGPSTYVTGGQTIPASALGWGGFDYLQATGLSVSGTYSFRVQYPLVANPSPLLGSVSSVKIIWVVVATGVEAGALDLSAEVGRFVAQGV